VCRKLDARVAEKVMGYEVSIDGMLVSSGMGVDGVATCQDLVNYSTDINSAFAIIANINETYWTSELTVKQDYEGVWTVKLKPAGCQEEVVFGHTPEVCMCLAALRASGDSKWVDIYLKEKKEKA
jgi:hypothetical protein